MHISLTVPVDPTRNQAPSTKSHDLIASQLKFDYDQTYFTLHSTHGPILQSQISFRLYYPTAWSTSNFWKKKKTVLTMSSLFKVTTNPLSSMRLNYASVINYGTIFSRIWINLLQTLQVSMKFRLYFGKIIIMWSS